MGTGFLSALYKRSKIDYDDAYTAPDYPKNHRLVHFQLVSCMVCALYLSKVGLR